MVISLNKAAKNISHNLIDLRKKRGLSQTQIANLSGITRASVALLESGSANPTLDILLKIAQGLHIPIEELISSPRSECKLIKAADVPVDGRSRHGVTLRKLLPEKLPSTEMDELILEPEAILRGVPHIEGTREFFTCIKGEVLIGVLGESYQLQKGDVFSFPGDKPHSYKNIGKSIAHGISVVLFVSDYSAS